MGGDRRCASGRGIAGVSAEEPLVKIGAYH
jgi:hypothetical protein